MVLVGGDPSLVATRAGAAHALVEGVELGAPDPFAAQRYPHRRQRLPGSEQEGVRVLIEQILTGRGAAQPNTTTGPGPACGLACQVAWICGQWQCSVR